MCTSKNKGFSLIEIIVVVVILGITASIAVLSVSYAYGANSERCAQKLSAHLDATRIQSIGMVDGVVYLRIEKTGHGYDAVIVNQTVNVDGTISEVIVSQDELCNSSLTISYVTGSNRYVIDSSYEFQFVKSSGAFYFATDVVKELVIEGSQTTTLVLVKETGRNYLK